MNSYEYQKLRGLKRKLYLIDLRGGKCEICGYDKNLSSFDFHHKDPSTKEILLDMRTLSNSTMESIIKEFEKCQVLCSNCHREVHSPDLEINKVREIVTQLSEEIRNVRSIKKPKCIDCGEDINYTYKRCKKCSHINKRKVDRPNIEDLIFEINTHNKTWCAKKYNVSLSTIRRWLM